MKHVHYPLGNSLEGHSKLFRPYLNAKVYERLIGDNPMTPFNYSAYFPTATVPLSIIEKCFNTLPPFSEKTKEIEAGMLPVQFFVTFRFTDNFVVQFTEHLSSDHRIEKIALLQDVDWTHSNAPFSDFVLLAGKKFFESLVENREKLQLFVRHTLVDVVKISVHSPGAVSVYVHIVADKSLRKFTDFMSFNKGYSVVHIVNCLSDSASRSVVQCYALSLLKHVEEKNE